MIYVALLRGINVGGNAKIEMSHLKNVFEGIGAEQVTTYINSGNVVFHSSRSADVLVPLIEAAIKKEFSLDIRIVLRTLASINAVCDAAPSSWTNDSEQKTDVMFLWGEIDNKDIMQKIVINPELENVKYVDGALIWNIGRENVTKGNGIKLIKTSYYRHMTVRNINTVRKLQALMQASEQ